MFLPSWSGSLLLKELEMAPTRILPTTLLVIALMVANCLAATVAGGQPAVRAAATQSQVAGSDSIAVGWYAQDSWRSVAATAVRARELLHSGYERAPALVIALGAFVVLPAVALVSFVIHFVAQRKVKRAQLRAAELRARNAEPPAEVSTDGEASLWSHGAWLTFEGGNGAGTMALDGRFVRIGRHKDNDIHLPDATVHRHHALIERTQNEAFVIVDLSGKDGSGVRVNGERQQRAELVDGDVIELGRTRLRFESAPI